ncbi:uncharacterized protein SPEM3 [Perognathus longimembris pacificus]|uniref:uncharacterized protein SPEM3 n=1 Tax=Perognathus longimembris pacificus TaxID=214514 RepID=UPI0020198CB0|nr:uncharacterized protein SPEM3 [Perognathus longimembris pacificus]
MGEPAHHGAQACSGTNPRKCQDLGDSILLILGSFILLNVGINVVTLLWRHLKNSLRIIFRHFFPRAVKNLCSRVSSRFHRHPSFLLRRTNHLESWEPDRNDEKISRCCWIPPQCVYAGAPTQAPWGLWKDGMMGTGEALRVTNLKDQASSNARPEISSQFLKMNKLDMVPPYLPQDSKTKGPDCAPNSAPAQPYSLTHRSEQTTTQSQTHTPEHTPSQVEGLPHTAHPPPTHAPVCIPEPTPPHCDAHAPAPILTDAPAPPTPTHASVHAPPPTPDHAHCQPPTATPAATQEQTNTLAPLPTQVPAPTPAKAPSPTPSQAPAQSPATAQVPAYVPIYSQGHNPIYTPVPTWAHSQSHIPEKTSTQVPVHGQSHPIHSHAHTLAPAPTSAQISPLISIPAPTPVCTSTSTLKPFLTFALATPPVLTSTSASSSALTRGMTTTPAPTPVSATPPNPNLTQIPSTLPTFGSSFSTGHVVYDARRAKQNMIHKCDPQNSGYSRKDLGTISRPQEKQGLVNSDTSEKTTKQHGGESTEPPSGSILGYLELGNMEWKISEDAKDKSCQLKTFPYCSFHPCSSEKKDAEAQAPVYPKFLVFTQDAASSKPCLHSPSTPQGSMSTIPPPCTLSLPLVPPRTFVLPQSSNHQKPSNVTQTPTSKPSPSVPASHFPIPPQFSTNPQPLVQSQCSESKSIIQNHGFSEDSRVPRNPGLTQNQNLHKKPGLARDPYLCKNPVPSQDSGLHTNPDTTQDSCLPQGLGLTQNSGIFNTPCHTQPSGLYKNITVTQTSGLQGSRGYMQDSRDYRKAGLKQDTAIYKSQDLSPATDPKKPGHSQDSVGYKQAGNVQDPGVYKNIGHSQDSRPQKTSGLTQDSEVNKSSELTQESGPHKIPGFIKRSCFHQGSKPTQDSGDYKNPVLTQDPGFYGIPGLTHDSNCNRSVDLMQATEVEKRLNFVQDGGIYRDLQHSQNSNLHKCSEMNKCPSLPRDPACVQDPGLPQALGLTQKAGLHRDSCLVPDPGLHKNQSCLPGTNSAQVLSVHQTPKPIPSSKKPCAYEMPLQKEEAEQHVSWSVPDHQNPCPSKAQAISTNLQTFSEVPVLVEVKPSSWRTGSQDWVYHPMGTVPSAYQNYRRTSVPPKNNWRPHCPGPGTRAGHVVFDARQKHIAVGRDKCEALSPRRFYQEVPSNSGETLKEWGYQNVMRTLHKEGANVRQK